MGGRRIVKLLVSTGLVFLSFTAAGCAPGQGKNLVLTIASWHWSGWGGPGGMERPKDGSPDLKQVQLPVAVGAEAQLEGLVEGSSVTVRVVSFSGTSAEIQLSQDMAPGLLAADIMNPRNRFSVTQGETTLFSTPSDDAGVNYEVTLAPQG